jgi:cyclohexa-1,5-dienecarbonyl-CoA hydratase
MTIAMMKEIGDALNRIGSTPNVCAIVFAAAPTTKAFSAGVSVEEHRSETIYQMLEAFHSIFRNLNTISKPVVSLVGGAALGGGCELVAYSDFVIATQSARFGQPEIKLAVFPPLAAVVLPRLIGERKAREMILTGELVSAEEAKAIGLVNSVVGDGELESKGEELLGLLRGLSAPALELARRAMIEASGLGFEEALRRSEDIYLNRLMSCKDPQEGVDAFVAKRAPVWKHK